MTGNGTCNFSEHTTCAIGTLTTKHRRRENRRINTSKTSAATACEYGRVREVDCHHRRRGKRRQIWGVLKSLIIRACCCCTYTYDCSLVLASRCVAEGRGPRSTATQAVPPTERCFSTTRTIRGPSALFTCTVACPIAYGVEPLFGVLLHVDCALLLFPRA